jgi:hypothetical protein
LIASFVAALGAIVFKKTVLWLLISLLPFYLKGKKFSFNYYLLSYHNPTK